MQNTVGTSRMSCARTWNSTLGTRIILPVQCLMKIVDAALCNWRLPASSQVLERWTLSMSLYMYKSKFTVDYCNHNQIYQYVPPTLPLSLDLSLRSAYAEGERKPRPQLSSNYIYINRSQHVTTQLCTRECLEKWKHEISPTIPCDN